MKRALTFVFVLGFSCYVYAQAVDTTVCEILGHPQSFNGKIVRIKGTVAASYDQFVIKGAGCGLSTNKNIWLSYPEGTKAKAGPAVMVQVQPAHNFAGDVPVVQRTPVTLDKNSKDFKLFDSQLATPYKKGGMCLGCNRFEVTATLVGRLDAVDKAGVQRDIAGKIIGFGGFGHMNAYATRLVLQSVSDVTSKEIDYSATLAFTKDDNAPSASGLPDAPGLRHDAPGLRITDYFAVARKLAASYPPGAATGVQLKRAIDAFGKEGDHNTGVVIVHGAGNEATAKFEGKGTVDSPDGLLFNCTFNTNRLEGDAEGRAIVFAGENVANLRNPLPEGVGVGIYGLESRAWATTLLDTIASKQKTLTLPGGYLIWNSAWTQDEMSKKVEDAIGHFLLNEELLHE
ncbi:MAG TPA: hypothetical protein VKF63_07545 [Terracidiphilus sp.]|nr:hypothetical protein [Terracidiphilus sp.]